jgi:putative hydrolase of the HAD superfamily
VPGERRTSRSADGSRIASTAFVLCTFYRVTREPISLPGRVVIFDYGDVISLPQTAANRAVIERLASAGGADGGADVAKFWTAYQAHRNALDEGVTGVRAYWRAIAADTGADWDDARVCELWAADFRSWISVNPDVIEVIADLKAGGTRLAVLSNAGADFGSYLRFGPLSDYFEAFFVSGELKLIKPDPAIFEHALGALDVTATEAIFTDNREDNVRAAQSLGITGHVFTGAEPLRSFFTSLLPTP